MLAYGEPARFGDVASAMTAGGVLLVLVSCVNGLAISYAGLKVPRARAHLPGARARWASVSRNQQQRALCRRGDWEQLPCGNSDRGTLRHLLRAERTYAYAAAGVRACGRVQVQQLITATSFMVLTNVNKFVGERAQPRVKAAAAQRHERRKRPRSA